MALNGQKGSSYNFVFVMLFEIIFVKAIIQCKFERPERFFFYRPYSLIEYFEETGIFKTTYI